MKDKQYNDKILNQFKCIIYNWEIDKVLKYYENDQFCWDYCIGGQNINTNYGCNKQEKQCPFKHLQNINLNNIFHETQPNYEFAKVLCLYLMYKQIYNDRNALLFMYYGTILKRTGTTAEDYMKSEKYYLKALSIDNNYGGSSRNDYDYDPCLRLLQLLQAHGILDVEQDIFENRTSFKLLQQCTQIELNAALKQFNSFQDGLKILQWLFNNDFLTNSKIKKEILNEKISLKVLKQCTKEDIEQLITSMKLKTTTRIKFRQAVLNLQQEMQMDDVKEEKGNDTRARNENVNTANNNKDMDSMSVYSGVSDVLGPFVVNNALIVFLGIGDYGDPLQNLPGVEKDYHNVLNALVGIWNYHALYKIKDSDQVIYSNSVDTIRLHKNKFKLHWIEEEIEKFVEEARKYVVSNGHNGVIFCISCHGDTGKVIYDSDMEEYDLLNIFKLFQPEWGKQLDTYQETSQMSQRLFQIPKIFCIDSCRGSVKAEVKNVQPTIQDTENNDDNKDENKNDDTVTIQFKGNDSNVGSKTNPQNAKQHEEIKLKTITTEQAQSLSNDYGNFCKLWANVDGFAVADGSSNGGLFLRNVARIFRDKKFVLSNTWTQIMFKIREYTKRDATLFGLENFTQMVENEGTLERPVKFEIGSHDIAANLDGTDMGMNVNDNKLLITNFSQTDLVAVLVENEKNNEDRAKLLQSLTEKESKNDENTGNDDNNNYSTDLFSLNGFKLIGKNLQCAKFVTIWDFTFITMINITKKSLLLDRKRYFEDYLYFDNDTLQALTHYKP